MIKKLFILSGMFICALSFLVSSNEVQSQEYVNSSSNDEYYPIQTSGIITDYKDTYFEHKDIVSIDFTILSTTETQLDYSLSYKTDGINVFFKNNSVIYGSSFFFSFQAKTEGEFTIEITASSVSDTFQFSLFIFSTDGYDFVSRISSTQAKRLYYKYLNENQLADESDYNEIVYGVDKDIDDANNSNYNKNVQNLIESEEPSLQSLFITDYIYVYGYVRFTDIDGNVHPAKGVTIIVSDVEFWGKYTLCTTETTDTGFYSCIIENDTSILENGYDIHVNIKFSNSDFQIQDSFVIYHYDWNNRITEDCHDNQVINEDKTFAYSTDLGKAMFMYQACLMGFRYLHLLDPAEDFPYLGVEYPTAYTFSFYNPIFPRWNIYIGSGIGSNTYRYLWDAVLHEFGHYVADYYSLSSFWPAEHSFDMDLISVFGKGTGTLLSWSEGWATYFSITCQREMTAGDISFNVSEAGDLYYEDNFNLETPWFDIIDQIDYLMGEGNEYAIALLLYDISDSYSSSEPFDNVSMGNDGLFYYLTEYSESLTNIDPEDRIWRFEDYYLSMGITSADSNFGNLLSQYKISAELLSPTSSSYSPPTFSWNRQGGITTHLNNDFYLYIMNSSKTLIFSKYIGDYNSITLSDEEWNIILASQSTSIYWNISSSQTTSPDTGPYFSGVKMCSMPSATTIHSFQSILGNIRFPGDFSWYKFVSPSSGYYSFFSTGSTDTYIEIFSAPVSRQTITGLLYFDNDSGVNTNFSKTIYMNSGQILYFRVRGNNWTSTGAYYTSVFPNQ